VASARLPEPDLDAVANVLKDLDPDVVALQELDRVRERSGGADQAAALAEALGMSSWYAPTMLYDDPVDRPGDRCPRARRTPAAPPTGSGCSRACRWRTSSGSCCPPPGGRGRPSAAGRGLAARSGRVAEARISDHLPVVVELEPR
jgi:hypothetical protein